MKGAVTMNMNLGTIAHTFSVTNDAGEKVQLSVVYDVSKAPEPVVKGWIASDRTIAFQRTLKPLTSAQIKAYNGKTIVYDGSRSKGAQVDPFVAITEAAKAAGIDPTDTVKMGEFIAAEMKKRS